MRTEHERRVKGGSAPNTQRNCQWSVLPDSTERRRQTRWGCYRFARKILSIRGTARLTSSELSPARNATKSKNEPTGEAASITSLHRSARAELIWEGKYDANSKRVAPLRVALPFQTVETVNESAQERQRTLQFESPAYRSDEWRNRLIWGDKKYVLPSLLAEFAGKVNLIYIDPPFDTGADFSFPQ
jgi:hypothetical protein